MNLQNIIVSLVVAGVVGFFSGQYATKGATASAADDHNVVIQVSSADPAVQTLALNNANNVMHAFKGKAKVEVVAYGPGLSILTAANDNTNRVAGLEKDGVTFSACGNTMKAVEKKTGSKPILTDGVQVVPGGLVRIMQLQSEGYHYIKP